MGDILQDFTEIWAELTHNWKNDRSADDPLATSSAKTAVAESAFVRTTVQLLTANREQDEALFASARRIRDLHVGAKIDLRAVIDLSNKCRINCSFCPMRRDNSHALPVAKATAEKIVAASVDAYDKGFRQLFLQAGEDITIIRPVIEALATISRPYDDWHFILNLGNHRLEVYAKLKAAGAHGYLIKHETANAELHRETRGETLAKRVHHMLLARRAG